jgi:predicted ArsR family transcriptional regulator
VVEVLPVQRTRREILNILKRRGSATLEELANAVGLVPVTVRAHLNVLERDDLVKYEEVRGRVGRPYYVYSLTEDADPLFPKNYHIVANRVIDSVTDLLGPDTVGQLSERIAETWAAEKEGRLAGKGLAERVAEVAKIRSEEGAWAEVEQTADGFAIVQYNCPCPQAASKHPEVVCAAELSYMRRLLNAGVERVQWSQDGARACRYEVPSQEGSATS